MNTIERAKAFGQLDSFLTDQGYEIEALSDPSKMIDITSELKKPYLTPMSSPDYNDFTEGNLVCLIAKRNGTPVMMGCARLEQIGTEPVGQYWERIFSRAYGTAENLKVIGSTHSRVERRFSGRLAYFGDLFASDSSKGSRKALRAFIALGHMAVSLQWDPDWTYCFIREKDVMRGAGELYGFNRNFGPAFKWLGEPPHPRDRSELLLAVSREDLPMTTLRTISMIKEPCRLPPATQPAEKN